jgi:hypothetical protein
MYQGFGRNKSADRAGRHTLTLLPAHLAILDFEGIAAGFMGRAGFFELLKGSQHVFGHDQPFHATDGSEISESKLYGSALLRGQCRYFDSFAHGPTLPQLCIFASHMRRISALGQHLCGSP